MFGRCVGCRVGVEGFRVLGTGAEGGLGFRWGTFTASAIIFRTYTAFTA